MHIEFRSYINYSLEYCAAGEFSPNGLAPCTKCPSNSYQPNAKSITCIKCDNSERTLTDGATTKTQCKSKIAFNIDYSYVC